MSDPYERVKEIRERHGGKEWWPTYREDPNWGPTPDGLTENDALDAVMEALNQEGVDAWSGDGTGIVAQMLHQQYSKRKALEARLSKMEERVEELETEGCGQCEACEDFFPLSLLSMTDDGVFLCRDDWADLLVETEALAGKIDNE